MKKNSLLSMLVVLVLCLVSTSQGASLGKNPAAGLVIGPDGAFYGTTSNGGTYDRGTVYRVSSSGYVTTLVNFSGTTGTGLGATPLAPLILGSDGKLYGTTSEGGTHGLGTVFRTSISGTFESLYSFSGGNDDGANPKGKLIQAADGNFYGMTYQGGGIPGVGTVFRMTPNGTEILLSKFGGADGAFPTGGLIAGRDGNFYGLTFAGGTNGLGTFFRMNPTGTRTVLYAFTGGSDGSNPQGELVQDLASAPIFYGTASNGGDAGYGTVYRFDVSTSAPIGSANMIGNPTVLATFDNGAGGVNPHTGLTISSDGQQIYGTAFAGEADHFGTVFQVISKTSNMGVAVLHSFAGPTTEGSGPDGALLNVAGSFYGTTYSGGQNSSGTVFTVGTAGQFQQLVDFANPNSLAPPVITSANSATINPNSAFSYQIAATGNPTSFDAVGLPSGLNVNTATGVVSGTVATGGNYSFTIFASNAAGTGNSGFQLIVSPSAPSISSTTTVYAQNGVAFSYQIIASNSPTSFSATGLPPGLSLTNPNIGTISGTPTVSGVFDVLVTASNNSGTGSATLHLTIAQSPPTITGVLAQSILRGNPFRYQIIANNNPTQYAAFVLPAGLSLDSSTGVITGMPVVEGTYKFTITATNTGGTGSATFTLTVFPPRPVINSAATATGTVGVGFSYQITTVEPIITPIYPISGASELDGSAFAAFGVPPGLQIDTVSGVISGIPTIPGTYTVVLEAGSTGGIGNKTVSITIGPARITSPSVAYGVVGQAFAYQVTSSSSGVSNQTFGASGLPPGLTLDTQSGVVSGVPTLAGDFQVTVTVVTQANPLFFPTGLPPLAATVDIVISNSGSSTPLVSTTTIQFSQATFTANGSDTAVFLPVNLARASGDSGSISVNYSTTDGDATAGQDYNAQTGTLTFAAGQTQRVITIVLHPQSTPQSDRSFTVNLSSPSTGIVGLASSATVTITNPDNSTKVLNVSTRGPVETSDNVMIAGFIVQGTAQKQIVLRGIGPSLSSLGVANAISDPNITLLDSNGNQLAFNDDYITLSTATLQTISSNGLTPSDARESALVASVVPGAYTAILRAKTNGIGLVEAYDITGTAGAKLVNISTRGKVGQGDNGAMIAGFIVAAPNDQLGTAQRVVVRAIGPSLNAAGVNGSLADTTLDLYRGSQLILSNDNWKTNSASDQQTLTSLGLAPTNDKEAALITTLDPGNYEAVVRGKNNTTGVALVEVYQLQ